MAVKTVERVTLLLNAIVLLGLTTCFILAIVVLKEGHDTALLLADTHQLSHELRQSSDDLTRFIRTYTVTGNASYWEFFQRVIRIRDGLDPLPHEPHRNFWDLYIADGVAPRGFDPPSAILARMGRAQFTDLELELLEEAKRQSDALIDLEVPATLPTLRTRWLLYGVGSGEHWMRCVRCAAN